MPLFRLHRGGLAESLATTVIIKNLDDLRSAVKKSWEHWPCGNITEFEVKVSPYYNEANCFDERIGWYTQIVLVDILEKGVLVPVGFLSEPLEKKE